MKQGTKTRIADLEQHAGIHPSPRHWGDAEQQVDVQEWQAQRQADIAAGLGLRERAERDLVDALCLYPDDAAEIERWHARRLETIADVESTLEDLCQNPC